MTTLWHSSINHWSVKDEFDGSAEKSCRELFCCCSSCSVDRQDAKFHRFTWLSSLIGFCNHFLGLASTSHFPRKKGMTFGHHVTLWCILHALGVILGLNDGVVLGQRVPRGDMFCWWTFSMCQEKLQRSSSHHICEGQRWLLDANGWCDGASSPQIPLEISYQSTFRVSFIMGCNDRHRRRAMMKYHWYHFIFYFILRDCSSTGRYPVPGHLSPCLSLCQVQFSGWPLRRCWMVPRAAIVIYSLRTKRETSEAIPSYLITNTVDTDLCH